MTIQELRNNKWIIFEYIAGSISYGLNTPSSDIDIRGIYIQPMDDILSLGYIEQISDETNDTTFYEVRRFLELLSTNNPNILEMVGNIEPIYKHPVFDIILEQKDNFISKICRNSFGGYAIQQIKKARGLNKKIVNPVDIERKNPLDFCNVHIGYDSIPLTKYLKDNNLNQKFCGIANVPHSRDLHALFYDFKAHNRFSDNIKLIFDNGEIKQTEIDEESLKIECSVGGQFLNYKGIVKESEDGKFPSNELRMSHINLNERENILCYFSYNIEGYTIYCKDYKEYWEWVEKRNNTRYNDNLKHGKGYDSKNLMHCHRLLDMAIEIGEGKGIIVKRPNREYLLKIRSGEMDYDFLVEDAENKIKTIDDVYKKSNLPERIDNKIVSDLLLKVRKEYYKSLE